MTRRSGQVDLGPLYMPVGDTRGNDARRLPSAADTERFSQLVAAVPSAQTAPDSAPALPFLSSFHAEDETARAGPAAQQSSLAAQLERLWLERYGDSRRELRASEKNAILPGMALCMYEESGSIGLEIRCGANASTLWLVPRVPTLARDLADRLGKQVQLWVYQSDGTLGACTRAPGAPA
jgi:hypothetical protein